MATLRNIFKLAVQPGWSKIQFRNFADVAGRMPLTFASPGQVFYNKVDVKQIDVPSYSGAFGILPNHVPILAVFQPGVVTVHEQDGATKKIFVSSGTITVNADSAVLLNAEEAVLTKDIDMQASREALAAAQRDISSAKDDKERAEAQIKVEVYEALVKAAEP